METEEMIVFGEGIRVGDDLIQGALHVSLSPILMVDEKKKESWSLPRG
jgi:hypothetical protein